MKEIKSLTGLRGFAAIYVMCGHIGFLQNRQSVFYKILPLRTFIDHGYISVDIFFILSGFVLMLMYHEKFKHGYSNWFGKFIRKRFARIFPLYIFILLIYIFIYHTIMYRLNNVHQNISSIDLFYNLILLQSLSHSMPLIHTSWSLSTEWITYFIFPLICFLCCKIKKFNYISFTLIIVLFTFLLCIISEKPVYYNYDRFLPF